MNFDKTTCPVCGKDAYIRRRADGVKIVAYHKANGSGFALCKGVGVVVDESPPERRAWIVLDKQGRWSIQPEA